MTTHLPGSPASQAGPAVSVIIPMYNAERLLAETLDSIVAQTLVDVEVIIVDDGSTDASVDVARGYAERDPRFRVLTGPGAGSAGVARNKGMALASGEYLAFLDADDLFAPSMLEKLYAKAKSDDADIVMTGFRSFDDRTRKLEPYGRRGRLHVNLLPETTPFSPLDIRDHIFSAPHTTVWNKIFRAEFIRAIGLQFQATRRSNDAYFNMVSLAEAKRLSYVDEHLVRYRASNKESLQGSQSDNDWAWADATSDAATTIRAKGLYEPFEVAMMQRVATRGLDRLRKCESIESFNEAYEKIRGSLFPDFGIHADTLTRFPNTLLAHKVRDFLSEPRLEWAFANVVRGGDSLAAETLERDGVVDRLTSEVLTMPDEDGAAGPDVSVVVPVYNSAEVIHECLQSVLAQQEVSVEVICVNDGSSDMSAAVAEDYAFDDPRVTVINQAHTGQHAARNAGLDAAGGRYIVFLDSDDHWSDDFLARAVAQADQDDLDVMVLGARSFVSTEVGGRDFRAAAGESATPTAVRTGTALLADLAHSRQLRRIGIYLVRTAHLRATGLRFNALITRQEGAFPISLLLRTDRAAHAPKPVYAHRVDDSAAAPDVASVVSSFATYIDVSRELAGREFAPSISARLDEMVSSLYATVSARFAALADEQRRAVASADLSADAQTLYRALTHSSALEARFARI